VISKNIVGDQIQLKAISDEVVKGDYVAWLNDPKVNRFLETRHIVSTVETQRQFLDEVNKSLDSMIYGIFCDEVFIGTIKVGPVNFKYSTAEVGLLIGNSNYWGRGIATESIRLASDDARRVFNLRRLTAGAYESNLGSVKAFLANGFVIEGRLKSHVLDVDEKPTDVILMGKVF
jgi:ribosomal-protein-alanine N-acetyltransferase